MAGIKDMLSGLPLLAKRQWDRLSGAGSESGSEAGATSSVASASELSELTGSADTTQVVFLPREPQWAYCFWTISEADQAMGRSLKALSLCLRLRDVSGAASGSQALQEIVVQAGRPKLVTIATNMAGRGTDIVLGGSPNPAIEAIKADLEETNQILLRSIDQLLERGEHLMHGLAAIERRDQWLHDRDGTIVSTDVAPRLEIVRFGDVPVALCGSLVFVEA